MRVTLYPSAWDAMAFYRTVWPAQVLQRQGKDIVITSPGDPRILYRANAFGDVIDVKIPDTDVAVFQRVTQRNVVQVIDRWQKAGIRVVIDMDDDLSVVTPHTNPSAFKLLNNDERRDALHWRWADEACKIANVVVCSTTAVYNRYGYGHGIVIRNCVPGSFLQVPHMPETVDTRLIGWTGAIGFRQQDPAVVGGAIARLVREGFRFRAVSKATSKIAEAFRIDYGHPVEVTGFLDIDRYPYGIAEFGVGIVPLAHTKFNIAKSWLTPLAMAACGVPCVMSDLPEYALLHKYGIGMLAHNPRTWYRLIRDLATNDEMYWTYSSQGRAIVARFTIENNADRWWEAWTGKVSH